MVDSFDSCDFISVISVIWQGYSSKQQNDWPKTISEHLLLQFVECFPLIPILFYWCTQNLVLVNVFEWIADFFIWSVFEFGFTSGAKLYQNFVVTIFDIRPRFDSNFFNVSKKCWFCLFPNCDYRTLL